ncbi:alanine racemase [Acinetobacter sp. ANC 5033]|uniref:alanine racemase n=1 Tax=Acinetobacter amyesii TaxID=2942470 RepID=UPI00201B501C|nr:alanine racemase [Acinetobacter amyesii]MCL6237864.1 alanine racemase [Acinetobacter amyesii]
MDAYFQQLNTLLKQNGTGMPQLIVDVDALNHNLVITQQQIPHNLHPRLVVKSLACMALLQHCATQLKTERFMLFHFVHLKTLFESMPQADVLFGKPMPIQALQHADKAVLQTTQSQVQWLIDSEQRLAQYLKFAEQHQLCLRINIEIDVGLHRGGLKTIEELKAILDEIVRHPQHLKFSGLMGYDAHVAKIPRLIQSPEQTYQQSQQSYQQFKAYVQQHYPTLCDEHTCWNGGGSPSFSFHCQQSVCNEVSFGSMLLKPADFELKNLHAFQSALWIATPVLKVLPRTELPQLEWLSRWAKSQAVFIYGGYWRGDYVYPQGSQPHAFYGRSSNQELVQIPQTSSIDVDDYIFLRPTQSEMIIPQFAQLWWYQADQFMAFESFRE